MQTRWLTSRKNGFETHRRIVEDAGVYKIEQRFDGHHPHAFLATGRSWFVSTVCVERGDLCFLNGGGEVHAPRNFILYLPPRSFVRMPVVHATIHTLGWGGARLAEDWPRTPLAVPYEQPAPDDASELLGVLARACANHRANADDGCPKRIVRSRLALVDAVYGPLPVGRVARRLGWNPSVFSRAFRKAYAVSPREYCKRVRVHDAMMQILGGASTARVAFEVGFGDLSQFYRQFRGVTGNGPGRYRDAFSRSRAPQGQSV